MKLAEETPAEEFQKMTEEQKRALVKKYVVPEGKTREFRDPSRGPSIVGQRLQEELAEILKIIINKLERCLLNVYQGVCVLKEHYNINALEHYYYLSFCKGKAERELEKFWQGSGNCSQEISPCGMYRRSFFEMPEIEDGSEEEDSSKRSYNAGYYLLSEVGQNQSREPYTQNPYPPEWNIPFYEREDGSLLVEDTLFEG